MSFTVRHLPRAGGPKIVAPRKLHQKFFPRTRHDVYHAAFLLRQVLVDDLVVPILDLAEYWLVESSHSDKKVSVRAAGWELRCQEVLSSPSLPQDWDYRRMRKIVLQIQSRDQRWSDYPEHHGTYRHSASWFEAGIASSDNRYAKCVLHPNMHAAQGYIIHETVWRCESAHHLELQWIKGLDKDTRLTVDAVAQFPGWMNDFKSGRIDFYFAAVTRL